MELPADDEEGALVKIYVDLPNHGAVGGEALWARALGDDLYEIHNVPFYAYDLNYLDVVRATASAPDKKPEVKAVVERSGHTTHRLMFMSSVPEDERYSRLESLEDFGLTFEGLNDAYFALDFDPEADFDAIYARLDEWVEQGVADYETCEARTEGSFDAEPGGPEAEGGQPNSA